MICLLDVNQMNRSTQAMMTDRIYYSGSHRHSSAVNEILALKFGKLPLEGPLG
jgi:hypothetical protein